MSRYIKDEEILMKGMLLALIFGPYITLMIRDMPIWLYLIMPSIQFSSLIGLTIYMDKYR